MMVVPFRVPSRSSGSGEFLSRKWACGAAGSALPWHGRGRRFDPDQVHQILLNEQECYADMVNHRLAKVPFSRGTLLLILWIFFCALPPAHAAKWTVRAQPAKLVNGGPALFQVKPPARLQSLTGNWLGPDVSFSFDA